MPRIYTVSFDQQTIASASGDYDLFELVPASNRPIEIVALSLGNKSEVGDAQDEMIAYSIVRGNTTSGSGGAAPTPIPLNSADPAAGFTAESVNSTIASTGTAVTLLADTFNVRAGLNLVLPDIMRPRCNADRICVRLTTAVADDLVMSGTVWVQEV
jgi:hypothetical protein